MAVVSPAENLVVRAVASEEELRVANTLMARGVVDAPMSALHWLSAHGGDYPSFQKEHVRIALWDGEVAAALRLNTETIQIGEARLKLGGVGWLNVGPRFRNRSVACALVQDTLEYMKRHRYDVSMVFGVPSLFQRFGFVPALQDPIINLDVSSMPCSPRIAACRERRVKPGDIPTLQKLHANNDRNVVCSLLRSRANFTNLWDRFKDGRVLIDPKGKVIAYLLAHREAQALRVDEVSVLNEEGCARVLAACLAEAQ